MVLKHKKVAESRDILYRLFGIDGAGSLWNSKPVIPVCLLVYKPNKYCCRNSDNHLLHYL
jgi:hypothetical protein